MEASHETIDVAGRKVLVVTFRGAVVGYHDPTVPQGMAYARRQLAPDHAAVVFDLGPYGGGNETSAAYVRFWMDAQRRESPGASPARILMVNNPAARTLGHWLRPCGPDLAPQIGPWNTVGEALDALRADWSAA
jgi:hypothetical protein